ncbi:hypothetical protein ACOME3_007198 [Neoechinorhynchus agilis]
MNRSFDARSFQSSQHSSNLLNVPSSANYGSSCEHFHESEATSAGSMTSNSSTKFYSDYGEDIRSSSRTTRNKGSYRGSFHSSRDDRSSVNMLYTSTALEQAIIDDDKNVVRCLLERKKKNRVDEKTENSSKVLNFVHIAIRNNALNSLKLCLRFGMDPDRVDADTTQIISQLPPIPRDTQRLSESDLPDVYTDQYLHCLPPIFLAIYSKNLEAVNVLIKHGARVNSQDGLGCTPLHIACLQKNEEMARLLIDNIARVHLRNIFGQSSFDIWPEIILFQEEFIDREVEDALNRTRSRRRNNQNSTSVSIRRRISSRLKREAKSTMSKKKKLSAGGKQTSSNNLCSINEIDEHSSNCSQKMDDQPVHSAETGSNRLSIDGISQMNPVSDAGSFRGGKSDISRHRVLSSEVHLGSTHSDYMSGRLGKLLSIARAPECNMKLIGTLSQHIREFTEMVKTIPSESASIAELLMNMIKGCYEDFVRNMDVKNHIEKFYTQTKDLLSLVTEVVNADNHILQFTAFSCINRLFDVYAHHNLFHPSEYKSWYLPESKRAEFLMEEKISGKEINNRLSGLLFSETLPLSIRTKKIPNRRRRHDTNDNVTEPLKDPFASLQQSITPQQLLEIITRKVKSTTEPIKCTPSTRASTCANHCIAIMAARLLAILSHYQSFQKLLSSSTNLQLLNDLLNHKTDPHTLCLLLTHSF